MKIIIELEYPDEQIEFFAKNKGKADSQDLSVFCESFLTEQLAQIIVQPFHDNLRTTREQEGKELFKTMERNAQAGITISVEPIV